MMEIINMTDNTVTVIFVEMFIGVVEFKLVEFKYGNNDVVASMMVTVSSVIAALVVYDSVNDTDDDTV